MGHCYKFTVNTHSPALRTDGEERSDMMPVLQSEAQAEHMQALCTWGWRLESCSCRGAGLESCFSTCLGSWVSWYPCLWHHDNYVALITELVQDYLYTYFGPTPWAVWTYRICLLNFCLCLLPLPSPLWPDMQRINLLWYFTWKRLLSTCWLLEGGHCYPSFFLPEHPFSEEVITASIRLCSPIYHVAVQKWPFILFLTLPHGLVSKVTHRIKQILT